MFDNMEFLQSAYTICFGIAIASAVLAVALFFLLNIREVFLIETGRAQRRAVEKMHHRNQKTGKLREDTVADLRTGEDATVKSTASAKMEAAGGGPGISFRVTKKTIVVHTDEKITL